MDQFEAHVRTAAAVGRTIRLSAVSGCGPTELAAFDSALRAAGLADFNLVRLSSVIPPGSRLVLDPPGAQIRGLHGDLLFCVYAAGYASTPGESVWAGLAWALRTDGSGSGLLVEQAGRDQDLVTHNLRQTVGSMMTGRGVGPDAPSYVWGDTLLSSAECRTDPVCALVIATYGIWPWPAAPEQDPYP